MVVTSDAATLGEKELKTDWPVDEGLELGTEKRSEETPVLEPEEDLTLQAEHWGSI